MTAKRIKGFKGGGGKGGGGGSSRTPVESPDDLRSRSYARVVDLICEGEIEGLATGDLKSVYLDQTPIQNSDGSYNFSGITTAFRNGTQNQSYINGFPSIESENAVNTQVLENTPIVRTITDPVYTMARVTMGIPNLSRVDSGNGDTNGTSVRIRIHLQSNGGSYEVVVDDTTSGKTTTKYQKSYLIRLTGDAPWNIKFERMTDDSASSLLQNATFWDSYTEIVEAKLRYPNSALVATIIDSQQFNSIPNRGYDMKMLRIKIPSNATPQDDGSLTYSGSWDGTFNIAWSSNPAWCFYDLVTNSRYGLGDYISEDQVDKWTLYQIGRYCDEQVPDGYGGTEPRFSCNLYIQTRQEAFKVVQDMATTFRGMAYWSTGLITATQDAPSDPVALYTNANVIDGTFTYSGSSLKTRHSVALVSWNDPADFYKLKPEYVEDPDAIARYGIVQTEVVAVGCSSRGQAHRVGKWILYTESNETETVSFKTGLDGAFVRPGQVIKIMDSDRVGARMSGRIASATTTSITVDSGISPSPGETYTLHVMLPDGTIGTSEIDTIVGNTVNLVTALSDTPQVNAIWVISSTLVEPQLFRVVSLIDTNDGQFEVSALAYNESKYDYVENNLALTRTPVSLLTVPPDSPQNIQITESLYSSGTGVKVLVTIAWDRVERADSYIVNYSRDDGAQVTKLNIRSQLCEIRDAEAGFYKVTVTAVNVAGKRSVPSPAQQTIFGKTLPPDDVTGFSLVNVTNGVAQLTWDRSTDLDVIIGGYIRIRYTPEIDSPVWQNSVDIGPALPGSATTASVPHVNGTYMARFVDSSGNTSANEAIVETTSASIVNMNVIENIDESAFNGVKVNCAYSEEFGGIVLNNIELIDDVPEFDDIDFMDLYGGIQPVGTYYFEDYYDLGGVFTSTVTASMSVVGLDYAQLIDSLTDIDSMLSFDGDNLDDVNATLYVRTTNDDPTGAPEWSSWRPFFVGQYTCRAYDFKLVLTSDRATHNLCVTSLGVSIDMPDRVEAKSTIASGASSYPVTFPNAFKATPSIGITAHNMQTGDYFTITSQSVSGFTITFRNSGGTAINRTFDYMAKGYGYSQ
jgi:predicted phage tail protein